MSLRVFTRFYATILSNGIVINIVIFQSQSDSQVINFLPICDQVGILIYDTLTIATSRCIIILGVLYKTHLS